VKNSPRADEPDAGHDTLDDTRRIGVQLQRDQHGRRSSQADQHVRAQPGSLVLQLAIDADQHAGTSRQAQPQCNLQPIHLASCIICPDSSPDDDSASGSGGATPRAPE